MVCGWHSIYYLSIVMHCRSKRICTARESNPGRKNGNLAWYHYTSGADVTDTSWKYGISPFICTRIWYSFVMWLTLAHICIYYLNWSWNVDTLVEMECAWYISKTNRRNGFCKDWKSMLRALNYVSWQVAWPSGLRRWFKAPVSSEAWVRIPPLPYILLPSL